MINRLKEIAKCIPASFWLLGTYRMLRYSKKAQKLQTMYPLQILNAKESVDYIATNKLSVGRFGDGEFDLIIDGRNNIGFQVNDKSLTESLLYVLTHPKENFAVGLPYMFVDVKSFRFWVSSAWRYYITKFLEPVASLVDNKAVYIATGFTRPYFEYQDSRYTDSVISSYHSLWQNRHVLIVEGKDTRFGVGNSLLSDAKQIKRILAPNKNAWSRKDTIKAKVLEFLRNQESDDWLVLIALGPTATVLAYELSDYVQSIDAGHMDLHFEYFQQHAKKVGKIKGKYVNEVPGGSNVVEVVDSQYLEQIITEIK